MARLFERIRQAVAEERYVIGIHADERLRERRIPAWQITGGLADAKLILERPKDKPHPSIEVEQMLADGTAVKVIWSWLGTDNAAKLVTVHFFD